jgi:SNF2 family DNA or RNA helicase
VSPNILGSISYFRQNYSQPIEKSTLKTATQRDTNAGSTASKALQDILAKIMIRRTQSEVGEGVLPGRVDVTIYCSLTEAQQAEYNNVADLICRFLYQKSLCVVCVINNACKFVNFNRRDDVSDILPKLLALRQISNFVPAGTGKKGTCKQTKFMSIILN